MSSESASQPESIDLAYDMWAGQFEFVGPGTHTGNDNSNSNNKNLSNNNSNKNKDGFFNNKNKNITFGDNNGSSDSLSDSLEDLNLSENSAPTNGNGMSNGIVYNYGPYQQNTHPIPILLDQETFLSLNPADFEDIVPSNSGPNSLVFIENKLCDDGEIYQSNNFVADSINNNKICNLDTLANKFSNKINKISNANTNGFKLENLRNFKNKLICESMTAIEQTNGVGVGVGFCKMNGLSAEICDNLNEQLELLQRKVDDLSDSQNIVDDRTTRTKTEYAVLQARYHMLEDQYREAELRAEERLADEQKRHREIVARMEREVSLQKENHEIKIRATEIEANSLRDEAQRLRAFSDKQANELRRLEDKLETIEISNETLRQELDDAKARLRKYEQEKISAEELMLELSNEVERLRAEIGPAMPTTTSESIRLEELYNELEDLRMRNKSLEEQIEELQATVLTRGVEEGRHLLNGTINSLAHELEEMSQTQASVDSATLASLSQLQQAFQEKEDENIRLKNYIDSILLNIVENHPQLLEVKPVRQQ